MFYFPSFLLPPPAMWAMGVLSNVDWWVAISAVVAVAVSVSEVAAVYVFIIVSIVVAISVLAAVAVAVVSVFAVAWPYAQKYELSFFSWKALNILKV